MSPVGETQTLLPPDVPALHSAGVSPWRRAVAAVAASAFVVLGVALFTCRSARTPVAAAGVRAAVGLRGKIQNRTTLYCVVVMRPGSEEQDVLEMQLRACEEKGKKMGILGCDTFDIFSTERVKLGTCDGESVESVPVRGAPVAIKNRTVDGTAANTPLFVNVWSSVHDRGHFLRHDWTVKVDPDTVLFADRLRRKLQQLDGPPATFVANCPWGGHGYYRYYTGGSHQGGGRRLTNSSEASSEASLYGSVEALSRGALESYFAQDNVSDPCPQLPRDLWGEDRFMGTCLQKLGVKRTNDFDLVQDQYCSAPCGCTGGGAAYHPYKSTKQWLECWENASAAGDAF